MDRPDPVDIFVKTLRDARLLKKMTQREVADRIGVTTQTFSNWETESSVPRFDNALKWAALMGYDVRLTTRKQHDEH
jgi:transcriptional regulator with XRE-family HTH domain